ncbi:MAG: YtxH domain-containing protein [Anaerolineales bacterium]|nr:YtxH domain-containing protein [Anaerolineales bacterium]
MRSLIRFFSGFIMGALVGTVLALLFSPTSGDELRSQIRAEAERVQDEVKKAASERRMELEHQLEAMRSPKTTS